VFGKKKFPGFFEKMAVQRMCIVVVTVAAIQMVNACADAKCKSKRRV